MKKKKKVKLVKQLHVDCTFFDTYKLIHRATQTPIGNGGSSGICIVESSKEDGGNNDNSNNKEVP